MQQPEGEAPQWPPQTGEEATSLTRYQLVAYDSANDSAEDPMVSEPICPFSVPIALTSPQTGHRGTYRALIDSSCTSCLISKDVVAEVGFRVRQLANLIRFEQVDGSLLGRGEL